MILTLLLTHSQSVSNPPAPASEVVVLAAVVAYLSAAASTSKCEVARSTFSHPGRWGDSRKLATPWHVSSAESPAPTRVSDDLITAGEAVNRNAVSLDAIPMPKGVAFGGGENSRADCIVRLSRPGISAEGDRALVDLRVEAGDASCRCPSGFIYLLEKRDGQWRVKGEGGHWITECVCVRKAAWESARKTLLPTLHFRPRFPMRPSLESPAHQSGVFRPAWSLA